jgi:hypothetical protein
MRVQTIELQEVKMIEISDDALESIFTNNTATVGVTQSPNVNDPCTAF